ncbi:endonuclease/exonuclease/phosphatase family protein [Robiginitomaculum antarcticum]|uniref:endonuclease/exonuclease/phosphatase family protein n=1 Tax=Robiginitomaculum antarcticum TaxID=437507 RepID=UPI0003802E79|nr:endonuclease/exonuclease/phosphatase family protein [Robiginitomaculum antarcticum]
MFLLYSVLYLLAFAGLIAAFSAVLNTQIWWMRGWIYPRIQIAIFNAVMIVAIMIFGHVNAWTILLVLGLMGSIIYCLSSIYPFTPIAKIDSPTILPGKVDTELKILVGNVLMDNEQSEGLIASIRDKNPDLIFLVETDEKWKSYLTEIESDYPHTYLLPLNDYNGMLFYSKLPIKDVKERYLVQDHIPSLTMDLDLDGKIIRFFGVHPRPPRPEDDTADMDQELQIIAREAYNYDGPVIVTGDLNDVGWSRTTQNFLRVSKLLDPRRGRGLFNSYNAKHVFMRWPLDHIFHSDHFGLITMQRLPKYGSDHFPIFISLGLKDTL